MQTINITPLPSQIFQVVLDNQDCTIKLYQRNNTMYMDLSVGTTEIFVGAICHNGTKINQFKNPDFKGTLHFYDTKGTDNPKWVELGSRFKLLYGAEKENLPEVFTI